MAFESRRRPSSLILYHLLALAILGCTATPSPPDLVLYNGKIFTADTTQPWVEAVLIQGERIAQIGTSDEMLDAVGSDARLIDLEQRTVVPGFNDAHDHIAPFPPAVSFLTSADPLPDPAVEQVLDSVRAIVTREPAGTTITTSVGEQILSDPRARRAQLDRVAPEHPVVLAAWTGHGQVLNSAALEARGLTDAVQNPLGGVHERDGAGRPTGLLEEYASYNLWSIGLGDDSAAVAQAYEGRAAQVVQWGITSVQSFGLA
jgi:predicted amidohydrolase YtcJ